MTTAFLVALVIPSTEVTQLASQLVRLTTKPIHTVCLRVGKEWIALLHRYSGF